MATHPAGMPRPHPLRNAILLSIAVHALVLALVLPFLAPLPLGDDSGPSIAFIVHDEHMSLQPAISRPHRSVPRPARVPVVAAVIAPAQPIAAPVQNAAAHPLAHVERAAPRRAPRPAPAAAVAIAEAPVQRDDSGVRERVRVPIAVAPPMPTPLPTATPTLEPTPQAARPVVRAAGLGGYGQNYPPIFAERAAFDALRAQATAHARVRISVDDSGRATEVAFLDPLDPSLAAELRQKLLALRYVRAECDGIPCDGTIVTTL